MYTHITYGRKLDHHQEESHKPFPIFSRCCVHTNDRASLQVSFSINQHSHYKFDYLEQYLRHWESESPHFLVVLIFNLKEETLSYAITTYFGKHLLFFVSGKLNESSASISPSDNVVL